MIKLPQDTEEVCHSVIKNPHASESNKKFCAHQLKELGLGDGKGLYGDDGRDQFFDSRGFN